ncbi:MAG: type I-U CRISPR-associated protein Csb2 [Planctomycetota bacterium]
MSVSLRVRFLAGRYHGTPWDHQVNEGVVEWPPSPWRLLRTLVAAAYKLPEVPERQALETLVTHLAEDLPRYQLPATTMAHTRHYMPLQGIDATTKVFDTFHVMGQSGHDREMILSWPAIDLEPDERSLLERLARVVTYLGRAESWASLEPTDEMPESWDAWPASEQANARLLCPLSDEELQLWLQAVSVPVPRKSKAARGPRLPGTVLEALELDTRVLREEGWSDVPGARWVDYHVARSQVRRSLRAQIALAQPTFARYAVVSAVHPSLTEALAVGDLLRRALMKYSDEGSGPDPLFVGRQADGAPLQDHPHAWFLAEDTEDDGRIDHLIVHARAGFSRQAVKALERLPVLRRGEGFEIKVRLVQLGHASEYGVRGRDRGAGRSLVAGTSRSWRSLTPVVLPRHPKLKRNGTPRIDLKTGRQKDSPEDQVYRLIEHAYPALPRLLVVSRIEGREVGHHSWGAFRRIRERGRGTRALGTGFGFRLEFASPAQGPIAIGYASHMGLGVFVPE